MPTASVPTPSAAAPQPHQHDPDLGELLATANDAARREVSQQWFFFITLMLLLAASVGTTTHRALLDATPMRLPLLNIDLPMIGFYAIAPTIFVVLHFYALLQVSGLRAKVAAFIAAAEAEARHRATLGQETYATALQRIVRPLDGFAVVQALAAPSLHQRALAARVMTAITLVIAPVLLLVFFLLRFLPYQDVPTTHLHRALIAIDLAVLWALMPPSGLPARIISAAGTVTVMVFCLVVATVRGEALDRPMPLITPLRDMLFFDGVLDSTTHRPPDRPFSRVLSLADERLIRVTDTELAREGLARTIVLRGRSLRGAILIATDLRKADLSRADLAGARLDKAWLNGAFLDNARLEGAILDGATMRDASLPGAVLTGASLRGTGLEGATLDGAALAGATLDDASLHGASLTGTSLEGASLVGARLPGAFLIKARLQGASLLSADLRGADLRYVQGWRADTYGARLADADARSISTAALPATWVPAAAAEEGGPREASPWRESVDAWLAVIPGVTLREGAARRLTTLTARSEDDPGLDARHADLVGLSPPEPRGVARTLITLACAPERAPYVARGILSQIWTADRTTGRDLDAAIRARVAGAMRDEAGCPGAIGLNAEERARLVAISEGLD
ncbi:pentapeptide repeat-containing protein [Elioraea sp.]|uniref:pentapeptide repeat-containing protein n=1 Tax=Elioraea sp. TaxID=2185103 RepID=UPI0025BCF1E8|nr:pentapeptide repeat-containing protein [Elioraea sp.]